MNNQNKSPLPLSPNLSIHFAYQGIQQTYIHTCRVKQSYHLDGDSLDTILK